MHLIKIKNVHEIGTGVPCYICAEEIVSIEYIENEGVTSIVMKNRTVFEVNGDASAKLAKLMILATSGSILTLE